MTKSVWAIVTGASSGIGKEFATIFAEHGINLVITARNINALNSLASDLISEHKVKVLVHATDLSHHDNVVGLVDYVSKNQIVPEYLINNAGFGDFGYFTDTKWEKEAEMIDLNIKTLTYLTKIYATQMKARGHGRIVNVASGAAFQPGPLMAIYFASKAYVLNFTEAVAEELAGTGVTLTTLCPGPTQSNFWKMANKKTEISIIPGRMPSSRVVAEYGYKSMMNGKRIAIQGTVNTLGAFMIRFVPRGIITRLILKMQKGK